MKQTLLALFTLTLVTGACKKDDPKTPVTPATTERRAKFIKTWNSTKSCTIALNGAYQITITRAANDTNQVIINNVLNEGNNITGVMNGDQYMTIPSQQYGTSAATLISGQLAYDENTKTFTGGINVQGPAIGDACSINGY